MHLRSKNHCVLVKQKNKEYRNHLNQCENKVFVIGAKGNERVILVRVRGLPLVGGKHLLGRLTFAPK